VDARPAVVRRARVLNRITIGWNLVEGVVAVVAGVAAGSLSLIGFGLDSGIEVSASTILAWRLYRERRGGCMADDDRLATRAIASSFLALTAYVWVEGARDLAGGNQAEVSVVGLVLVSVSVVMMPFLARAKRRLAPALGSRAAISEANQTMLCALLSGVVLVGLALNALAGWWWADPAAGIVIGFIAAGEAVRAWRAEALEDTCCA
jgi:divalent metal cation (Fe/Co/Zn/Cd) transporter